MKKNLTELVFILDRSGSMGGLEQDTIGGFNAMLTRQKEQEGEANVTTILFDHEVQLLHDRFPLKAVAPLTEKDYYVRGCTALLDAVKEAARFGISSDRAVRFENDAQGVAVNYHVVSETVSRMREAPCCASIGAEWKEQIEADFQKRHHR